MRGSETVPSAVARDQHRSLARWRTSIARLQLLVEVTVFLAAPVILNLLLLVEAWDRGELATDLTHFELPAAEKIVNGQSPYPEYGYPPLVAFTLIPLVWIPAPDIVATVLLVLSVPAILWLLRVRDWRCYGTAFLWAPVFVAIQSANVTLPMMLCLAIAWRYRDSARISGPAVGLAAAAKILAWPGGLWLLATRRVRGWLVASITAVVTTIGLWAIIGFDGATNYDSRVQANGVVNAPDAYTITQFLVDLGAERRIGQGAAIAVAVGLLAACVWAGWRGADRLSYALAATCCVYCSPITWMHSFAFLLLGVAVLSPRFSVAWLLPIGFFMAPGTGNGSTWQTGAALAWGFVTIACAILVHSRRSRPRHSIESSDTSWRLVPQTAEAPTRS